MEKGYVRLLTEEERSKPPKNSWYLPIFPVENPNKPGKVRIVWDAAARVGDTSLNSMLLTGPDLTEPLLNVLFRFRECEYAIVGDLKEMFHQVLIKEEDQQAQRFIRRKKEYLMKVMTFGSKCSPSCAQYVKNFNADQFATDRPEAHAAITRGHYVDDWLGSYDSEADVIRVATDVINVHQQAGFHVRNWKSNSANVLKALGETSTENPQAINLNLENHAVEKVLGMWWSPSDDTFTYSLKYNKENRRILVGAEIPTKRELLRILMSVYDPLGLISHFMVYLKSVLQNIWRTKIGWDDKITEKQYQAFKTWLDLLPNIETLKIPRCYISNTFKYTDVQLHVFVHASEKASSAVAYLSWGSNLQIGGV